MVLPAVFSSEGEQVKFMARIKDRASKDFRWTASRPLEDAMYLAYWSHVFGREEDALQVCAFLSQFQFAGNYHLWSWVERTLALYARLSRKNGDLVQATECTGRIREAGFVETRIDGALLASYQRNIDLTTADGRNASARDWRAIYATELCVMIEMRIAADLPSEQWEELWQENLSYLRSTVGVIVG